MLITRSFSYVIALGLSASAAASNWTLVSQGSGVRVSVDAESISPKGKLTKAWVMFTYDEPHQTDEYPKKQFQSIKSLAVYDCGERTYAVLQSIKFANADGIGEVAERHSFDLEKSRLDDVSPDSSGEAILNYVCRRAKKPSPRANQ